MVTGTKQTNEEMKVKRDKIQPPIDEYTSPQEAYIYDVTFDEKYMYVELTDERVISIPLRWIPTLYKASDKDRRTFQISQNRKRINRDPEKCDINDEINILDYLGPTRTDNEKVAGLRARQAPPATGDNIPSYGGHKNKFAHKAYKENIGRI